MKKLTNILCLLICVLTLSVSGSTSVAASIDFPGSDQETFESGMESFITYFENLSDDEIQEMIDTYADYDGYEYVSLGLSSYQGVKDEIGTFVSVDSINYEEADEENTYTAIVDADYSDRDCTITIEFVVASGEVTAINSMSFEAEYTLAETMKQAGMNTLMGICTVFAILILISFIISLFKFIPIIMDKLTKKKDDKDEDIMPVVNAPVVTQNVDETDDLELVAVIAAAIAASENTSTDDFVVRSIRRRY